MCYFLDTAYICLSHLNVGPQIDFINFDSNENMLLNDMPCTDESQSNTAGCIHTRYTGARELVKTAGDSVYMMCAATGGDTVVISWTFTSRYLISKNFHCQNAPLPDGCSVRYDGLTSYCPKVDDSSDNVP